MIIPEHTQVYDTPLAVNWLNEHGIVCSISKDKPHTLENMTAHFEIIREMTKGTKRGFLVDPTLARPITVKERKFLNEHLQDFMSCVAFVTKNKMMKIAVNIYFRLRPTPLPMKMFDSIEQGLTWVINQESILSDSRQRFG